MSRIFKSFAELKEAEDARTRAHVRILKRTFGFRTTAGESRIRTVRTEQAKRDFTADLLLMQEMLRDEMIARAELFDYSEDEA